MSFLAKLIIDDNKYNVLEVSFGVRRNNSITGRATGFPILDTISIKLESTTNTDFYSWCVNVGETRDGEIIFYKRDSMTSSRTLIFESAICVGYHEQFSNKSSTPMILNLELSTPKLGIDGNMHVDPTYDPGF